MEYPEDEQPRETGEDTVDTRPLIERIADKQWKTRQTAYDDFRKELSQGTADPSLFSEFQSFVPKMVADSNAVALDAGIDASIAFVDAAPLAVVKNIADKVCQTVIDKVFSARPSTQLKGKTLLLKLMEVDDTATVTPILLSKLADKKPKIPPCCLEIIKDGVAMFGVRAFAVREVIAALAPVLNGTNGAAREVALALMVDLVCWIGKAPFHTILETIRTAQKTEFEKLCAERETENGGSMPQMVPSLYLRKDRPSAEALAAAAATSGGKTVAAPMGAAIDSREFVEEIDLAKRLRATDYATLIEEEKWSEQQKALQLVVDILGPTPKIKPGSDVHDIMSACKGFLRQGHVILQVLSLKIIALMADGLRGEFGPTVRPLLTFVVQKVKEKRLVPDVQAALSAVMRHCLSFEPISEDILELIRSKKNPAHSRVGLMEFICNALFETPDKFSTDHFKPLAEALIATNDDSDPKVRESGVLALGAVLHHAKKKSKAGLDTVRLISILENSNPRIFKRIQQAMEAGAGTVSVAALTGESASAGTSSSTASSAASGNSAPASVKSAPAAASQPASSTASAAPSAAVKRASVPGAATGSTSNATKKPAAGASSGSSSNANEDDAIDDLVMTVEDAQAALAALEIPDWETVLRNMDSAKWQEKAEAVAAIGARIAEVSCGGAISAALVSFLAAKTSGFKISNVNILKAVMTTASQAAQNRGDAPFSKPAAWELIKNFGDKMSDKKTKELVDSILSSLSASISPNFVVKRMKTVMDKTKAPVAHQYYLEWLKSSIQEVGANSFPVQFVCSFCREEVENKVATVRIAAVEVLGALFNQLGPRMQSFALSDDMKPQIKTVIEAEFAKVGYDPQAAALKAAQNASNGSVASAGAAIPRQDLCNLLDKNILSELNLVEGKTSWQNRKAAIEAISAACERSGHYLEANKGTIEIIKALKARLNDTQANLKPLAAIALGHVIASVDIESASKVLRANGLSLLLALADNKKPMRDAVIAALQMSVTGASGVAAALSSLSASEAPTLTPADPALVGVLVPIIPEALITLTIGRHELLVWLMAQTSSLRPDHGCSELVNPLIVCLQDKTAIVRSTAEQVLMYLMTRSLATKVALDRATRDLPQATRRSMQGSIDRLMNAHGTGAAEAPTVNPTSAPSQASTEPSAPLAASTIAVAAPIPVAPAATAEPAVVKKRVTVTSNPVEVEEPQVVDHADVGVKGIFRKTSKTKRLEEFYKLNWPQPPEEPGANELAAVKALWEPLLPADLAILLFPTSKFGPISQDSVQPGLVELGAAFESQTFSTWFQHTDLAIRYLTCCISLRESPTGLLRILTVYIDMCGHIKREGGVQLHDSEINCILPHLMDKAGHKSERHRALFKQAIASTSELSSATKITQMLMQGLASKNKKSRVVCIEEVTRIVEKHGISSITRQSIRELAEGLDSKDADTAGRSACLDLCVALYSALGSDVAKLFKLLGDLSERSTSMVEERIRQKSKVPGAIAPAVVTAAQAVKVSAAVGPATSVAITATSTPPKFASGSDESEEPFRLVMTPPSPGGSSTGVHLVLSPVALNSQATTQAAAADQKRRSFRSPQLTQTPAPSKVSTYLSDENSKPTRLRYEPKATGEVSAMFSIMADSIDEYLALEKPSQSEYSFAASSCRDHIKVLHAMVCKEHEWVQAGSELDTELINSCDALVERLVQCLQRSFDISNIDIVSTDSDRSPITATLGMDVTILAISLATLFAVVKRQELVNALSQSSLALVFRECLLRLVDPRLNSDLDDKPALEAVKQIINALNTVLLKLASSAVAEVVLATLLDVLRDFNASSTTSTRPLIECLKPTSRLIRRVLYEQAKKESAYLENPSDTRKVISSVHEYFVQCPLSTLAESTHESDTVGYATAKTVLSSVITAVGETTVLNMIKQCRIPSSAGIIVLTQRLARNAAAANIVESSPSGPSAAIKAQVVAIIDDMTASRDKNVPIRKLWELKQQHPELDLNAVLQPMSSAFRRFVLDTLARMGEEEGNEAAGDADVENQTTVENVVAPISVSTQSTPSSAVKPPLGVSTSAMPPPSPFASSSQRSLLNDKIWGSLNSLTASLDLPPMSPKVSSRESVGGGTFTSTAAPSSNLVASTGTAPSVAAKVPTAGLGAGGDQDLAARLVRLRAMQAERR